MDWNHYDQQEDDEPFDALLKAKGAVEQADQERYDQETKIQSYLRMVKMNLASAFSHPQWLRDFTDRTPVPDAAYCKTRLDGEISQLLQWHYYLALYFAEHKDWLAKAIPLILGSAERPGGGHRPSSYMLLAHNLNRWHNCKEDGPILELALRYIREHRDDRYAHWCAKIVEDLEPSPKVRDEVRDLLMNAAEEAKPELAPPYLDAAISVASDKEPAKAAWTRMHEQYADLLENPMMKIAYYNGAKRHLDDKGAQRRINNKIKEAQKRVKLTGTTHEYEIPRRAIHGRSGFERVQHLVMMFRGSIPSVEKARMLEEEMREKYPLQHLFTRVRIADDGIPSPIQDARNEGDGAADHVKQFENAIQFLAAAFSANVRAYEKDGRISEDSYASYLESIGLHPDPAKSLIAAGIKAHFSGDYVASVHILLPQVEQTLRLLLEQKGVNMLGGGNRVRQDLLKRMIMDGASVLGQDFSEFLRIWLVDENSLNFRNRVCHALYGDYQEMEGYDPLHELKHCTSLLLILVICLLATMSVDADRQPVADVWYGF